MFSFKKLLGCLAGWLAVSAGLAFFALPAGAQTGLGYQITDNLDHLELVIDPAESVQADLQYASDLTDDERCNAAGFADIHASLKTEAKLTDNRLAISYDEDDVGAYYCFEVTDRQGESHYLSYQIRPKFQLIFLMTAVIAGVLTILSPCVLPLLPIVVGSSVAGKRSFAKPLRVIVALALSVLVFSLLLKASTSLIKIPNQVWGYIAGVILIVFGILTLRPQLYEKLISKLKFQKSANSLLAKGVKKGGAAGDIVIGLALGPVFSSCSPTYAVIIALIASTGLGVGLIYLIAYVLGLSLVLVLIALLGNKLAAKLSFLTNPKGWFKISLAVIFMVVGVLIFTGSDKRIEAWLLEKGVYDGLIEIENNLN